MSDFTVEIPQCEYLAGGAEDVNTIVTVTSPDTGVAAPVDDLAARVSLVAATLLAKVVDVVDAASGTVQLKRKVDDADEMALDTRSTKTVRTKK
jgi:von Willebrand factor type A C-terminal domain